MKEINVNELVSDYKSGLGIYDICSKYHIGKIKAKDILVSNGVPLRHRGKQPLDSSEFVVSDFREKKYEEHDGFHYVARSKDGKFETKDYMNLGGNLTTYISKEYGIPKPTLYDRRLYYMRSGNYWWEQWFDIVEIKDNETKKCPYCEWETNDIENRGGSFAVHLLRKHGMTKFEHLEKHPEDKGFFAMANLTANLQMETDKHKFVVCRVCGKKLRRVSSEHLRKHGLTKKQYLEAYGNVETVCDEFSDFLTKQMETVNTEMTHDYSSKSERELFDMIRSWGVECKKDRRILHGKELDIYIPSHNLAIEYNGNIWHSEFFGGKNKTYHLEKLEECNKHGIKLIQIFEDEYALHKDIVVAKIRHMLNLDKSSERIQARKCVIEPIDKRVGDVFLEENHIQGSCNCSIMLGAFYHDNLVAVMSLLNENGGKWNLTRFASKIGLRCQGVASKIFTHFIRCYSPKYVRSFADRRWTVDGTDNLYTKLNFKLQECTRPNYTYYNSKIDRYKRYHKFGFKKKKLMSKYGFDQGMSELEMARKLGYDRIWDCGLFKYVWRSEDDKG